MSLSETFIHSFTFKRHALSWLVNNFLFKKRFKQIRNFREMVLEED